MSNEEEVSIKELCLYVPPHRVVGMTVKHFRCDQVSDGEKCPYFNCGGIIEEIDLDGNLAKVRFEDTPFLSIHLENICLP